MAGACLQTFSHFPNFTDVILPGMSLFIPPFPKLEFFEGACDRAPRINRSLSLRSDYTTRAFSTGEAKTYHLPLITECFSPLLKDSPNFFCFSNFVSICISSDELVYELIEILACRFTSNSNLPN